MLLRIKKKYKGDNMQEIIADLRKLKAINKKVNNIFTFDTKYKYILKPTYYSLETDRTLKSLGYEVKYISGCFNPYICKIEKEI